ncbi:MAG: hypothetical protein K2X03_02405 [Bryobacteraceae bacterium]|nr:hypothetical protein [Bryobacteraceae bacterium]
MQQKTITVVIDQGGDSSVDLDGFGGQGCEKVLKDFQGADRPKLQRRKPAFYGDAKELQDQRVKSRS